MKVSLNEISKENDAKEIQIYFDMHSKTYMEGEKIMFNLKLILKYLAKILIFYI